jgi:cob(I)alamin adenosyltransferase
MKQGLTHVYCGDGKGKTTAAMGLCLRAAGRGMRVLVVQFLKDGDSGELKPLSAVPGIRILRGGDVGRFVVSMTEEEKKDSRRAHDEKLRAAADAAKRGECDLLVLDEIIAAYNLGMVDGALVRELVEKKPEKLVLVLTGRNPPPFMLEAADYVSEIRKVKHPFDRGVTARNGIEK